MSYFHHPYASNSDLKEIVARSEGRAKPDNLQAIFDFGTELHAGILEHHKMQPDAINQAQKELIAEMEKTFWRDTLCRNFVMQKDFRREHEFYRLNRFGVGARCKCDGESAGLHAILELKGLAVTSQKQFIESIMHLDYDQGAAWYINVASGHVPYEHKLIVGISKKEPDRLFKVLIDKNNELYKSGLKKVHKAVGIWKSFGLI